MWLTPGLGNLFRLFLPFGSKKRAVASPVWEVGKATASSVAPSERRRAQRRAGDPIQVLIATDLTGVQSIRGWVRDRSSTGLGLSCSQEVQPGTILYVRAAFVTDDLPWIAIAVKHCHCLLAGGSLAASLWSHRLRKCFSCSVSVMRYEVRAIPPFRRPRERQIWLEPPAYRFAIRT
jgi:hypothetical protein